MGTPLVVVPSVAGNPHIGLLRILIVAGPHLVAFYALMKGLHNALGLRVIAPSSDVAKGSALQVLSESAGREPGSVAAHQSDDLRLLCSVELPPPLQSLLQCLDQILSGVRRTEVMGEHTA